MISKRGGARGSGLFIGCVRSVHLSNLLKELRSLLGRHLFDGEHSVPLLMFLIASDGCIGHRNAQEFQRVEFAYISICPLGRVTRLVVTSMAVLGYFFVDCPLTRQ